MNTAFFRFLLNRLIIAFMGLILLFAVGCQSPTKVSEVDLSEEDRVFGKIQYGQKVELKRSIIVDVRSQFEHEMSRPPRSFFAYWKDWDLRDLKGNELDKKRKELQRILALKGVDPLTQVVVLGKGLKGDGEEFLIASTLFSLGIERVSFLSEKQATKALLARHLPPLENREPWSKPLQFNIYCTEAENKSQPEVVISKKFKANNVSGFLPGEVFDKNLEVKSRRYPKSLKMQVASPNSFWAHGLALYFRDQGRRACVQ